MTDRLLVVAAHPDDEVLGCGATVRLRVDRGWTAWLAILATGATGRLAADAEKATIQDALQQLNEDSERAARVIGFERIERLNFPDNRLDTVSRMDLSHAVRGVIEECRPSLVLTHHPGDYNWDHTLTFDAVMMAARANPPDFSPSEIWSFEVLSSTERGWQTADRAFHPNLYVDVHETIEKKKLALAEYRSERRDYPHPRSVEGIEYQSRRRGNEVGLAYAEAFHMVRKVER